MTILNATVAPTCAVIAQDSRATRPDGGLLGYTGKLIILTDRGFAVGRRGSLKFTEAWAAEVKETQHLTLEDADATADALRRLSRRIECSLEGHGVAHVGWSCVTNAPMGFYFDGASNFEPQHLIPGVHLRGPAVLALDEPDYPALAAMSVPAANGER
ncbi:hypothetical protein [Insolitispirillum peregrinum]|uniref:hypothetical protein n=1 Tax=Insolitispirillum peregrinum TaxID=80876 RepID=UPI00361DE696